MTKLTLLIELSNGERQAFTLEQSQTLTVLNGAVYTIVVDETQQAPDELILKRKDDALVVEVDGKTVALIIGFYSESMTATFSSDGSFTPTQAMTVSSADMPVVVQFSETIVWKAQQDNYFLGETPLIWAAGLLGAVRVGAIANSN